jgi:hypothetical protein
VIALWKKERSESWQITASHFSQNRAPQLIPPRPQPNGQISFSSRIEILFYCLHISRPPFHPFPTILRAQRVHNGVEVCVSTFLISSFLISRPALPIPSCPALILRPRWTHISNAIKCVHSMLSPTLYQAHPPFHLRSPIPFLPPHSPQSPLG